MQNKFQNKYRIPSARLQMWDYSNNGAYFITICTQNRHHFFGYIQNQEMQLSKTGKLAEQFWHEIPSHFPMVELGNFVVMPNHVHGILIIDKPNDESFVETRQCLVSTVETNSIIGSSRFQNQGKNTISSIVGSYKSIVTKMSRQINPNFAWQSRFHDHIIRNERDYLVHGEYIQMNVQRWHNDEYFN